MYAPREESFPIPLKIFDVTRATSTSLDAMLEKNIDDYWNVDGDLHCVNYLWSAVCPNHVPRSNFPVDSVERSLNLCRNSSCANERTSSDTACTTADAFIGDGEMRFHGAPFPSLPARQTRHRSKHEVQQSMSLTTGSGQQARVSRHQHRTSSFLLCETGVLTATCRTKLHHGVLAVQHATRDDACCEQVRVGNPFHVPRLFDGSGRTGVLIYLHLVPGRGR